jgi:DNA polymerase-3 subunit delta'
MSWDTIVGHEAALERFRRSVDRGRLASTYLFVGPEGVGKRTFALKLAQAILCETNPITDLAPCGHCSGCLQVASQTHPDLLLIAKPADKSILPVDLFIGKADKRHRTGLVHDIGLKPFRGGHRIAIIDDADHFNVESANCLLKTLEEPPPNSILILLGTSEQRQLQTIVSRSQVVRFDELSRDQVREVIESNRLIDAVGDEGGGQAGSTVATLESILDHAGGSVQRALQLVDPEVFEFRQTLCERLATGDPHAGEFAKTLIAFSDTGGKEAYRKRRQMKLAGDFAIDFYRACCLRLSGVETSQRSTEAVEKFVGRYVNKADAGASFAGDCIDRTSEFQYHVSANAGLPNSVDSWLIDLGRLCRGELVTTGATVTGSI